MNYTKAYLELVPRVAEIMGPWEPRVGDWCVDGHPIVVHGDNIHYFKGIAINQFPPLWLPTLEQCLDWLREQVGKWYRIENLYDAPNRHEVSVWDDPDDNFLYSGRGQTRLEAAYRTVIAVGKGE